MFVPRGVQHLDVDGVEVAELVDRRQHQRIDVSLLADLAAQRLVDAVSVPAPELLEDIEHAQPGHYRQASRLLERGDEESGESVQIIVVRLVRKVRCGDGNARRFTNHPGREPRDQGANEHSRERHDEEWPAGSVHGHTAADHRRRRGALEPTQGQVEGPRDYDRHRKA